jgi:hypothetical protein
MLCSHPTLEFTDIRFFSGFSDKQIVAQLLATRSGDAREPERRIECRLPTSLTLTFGNVR